MFATLPLKTFLHARSNGVIQFPSLPAELSDALDHVVRRLRHVAAIPSRSSKPTRVQTLSWPRRLPAACGKRTALHCLTTLSRSARGPSSTRPIATLQSLREPLILVEPVRQRDRPDLTRLCIHPPLYVHLPASYLHVSARPNVFMNSLVRSTATFQEQDLERSIGQNFVPRSCAPKRLTQDPLLLHSAPTSFLRSLFAYVFLTLQVGTFSRFPSQHVLLDTFLLKMHCIARQHTQMHCPV